MVYLRDHSAVAGAVSTAMRAEASSLMVALGYDLSFARENERETESSVLVVVDFRGYCDEQHIPGGTPPARPLATTAVADRAILPFSSLDCSALSQFLSPVLRTSPADSRAHVYGRALGRLLSHELYHIVRQTKQHQMHGVAQSSLSPWELTSENFIGDFERCKQRHKKIVSLRSSKSI